MDPNATWQRLLQAIEELNRDEVVAAADDLGTWLQKGGFMPTIESHDLEFVLATISDLVKKPA